MTTNSRDYLAGRHDRKPEILFDELRATVSPVSVSPLVHQSLFNAISTKHRVALTLTTGGHFIVEPHVYGMRGGHAALLVYMADVRPPWQMVDARQIVEVTVRDESFSKREIPPEFDPDHR